VILISEEKNCTIGRSAYSHERKKNVGGEVMGQIGRKNASLIGAESIYKRMQGKKKGRTKRGIGNLLEIRTVGQLRNC